MLLEHGRGEIAVMTAITTVQLYYNAVDRTTYCSVVRTGKRGYVGNDCRYSSTVISQCYGYREFLQCC